MQKISSGNFFLPMINCNCFELKNLYTSFMLIRLAVRRARKDLVSMRQNSISKEMEGKNFERRKAHYRAYCLQTHEPHIFSAHPFRNCKEVFYRLYYERRILFLEYGEYEGMAHFEDTPHFFKYIIEGG